MFIISVAKSRTKAGTSLVVQWLRICTYTAGSHGDVKRKKKKKNKQILMKKRYKLWEERVLT